MILEFLIGQFFLVLFNITNAFIDAYRILKNKTIAHAVNFCAYIITVLIICFLLSFRLYEISLFLISAFFNRQLSFDIPLNLRRCLPWYYQSQAEPPAAVFDKIERAIFSKGQFVGKKIVKIYSICYIETFILWAWTTN